MLTEHKRVKHGQMPGDVSRRVKISMRESGATPVCFGPDWSYVISDAAAKTFRGVLVEKSKTVQRRRDRRAVEEGLAEARDD